MSIMKGEKVMKKVVLGLALFGVMGLVAAPIASAEKTEYEEAAVSDGGKISGKITFKGTVPEPKVHELAKFPNPDFCAVISDGKGNRVVQEVKVGKDGTLQDVVVYIPSIMKGKPFKFGGTDVKAANCQFLAQGPSTFAGVVKNKSEFRVLNTDADPNDPKAATGVLHNPHTYEIDGPKSKTMFNVPLPEKGQTVNKDVKLRKVDKGSHMKLECDQHNYMQAFFLPVENPYYAVVGEGGSFTIDGVPPGDYEILAWHPALGNVTQKVTVAAKGAATADFTFKN
jgi:hypothetical protein